MVLVGNLLRKKDAFSCRRCAQARRVKLVTSQIINGEFVDGKITSGVGDSVKNNLQLKADYPLAN